MLATYKTAMEALKIMPNMICKLYKLILYKENIFSNSENNVNYQNTALEPDTGMIPES